MNKILSRSSVTLFLLVGLLAQCITEFDPELNAVNTKLVVDGLITDQPGPYQVRITYSAPYNNTEAFAGSPAQASVYIKSDSGEEELLKYTSNGFFTTQATGIQGIVGRQYWLTIVLPNGTTYESIPELLQAAPEIDTVYTEYQELNAGFLRGKFKVFLDTYDPAESANYYRWSWTHYITEEICGYTYEFQSPFLIKIPWGCCEPCWTKSKCVGCINIGSDKFINGRKLAGQHLVDVPYNSLDPYYLLIEQQSLTKSAYEYWWKIRSQVSNSGGAFDTPPIAIKGNLKNHNDPNEPVLGYFGASSIQYKSHYVDRRSIGKIPFGQPKAVQVPQRFCKPCLESFFNTSKRPLGWID